MLDMLDDLKPETIIPKVLWSQLKTIPVDLITMELSVMHLLHVGLKQFNMNQIQLTASILIKIVKIYVVIY